MELQERVGARLKESRKAANLTQKQAAEALGILQPAYARYESGAIQLDYAKLVALCRLYGVSADYLLGLEDEAGTKTY